MKKVAPPPVGSAGTRSKTTTKIGRSGTRLERSFFERPAVQVAEALLGKCIVRRYRNRLISSIITETEAYAGPGDRASRAFGGRHTHSVRALYSHPGTVYVYLVYGMHWLLNLKAARPDQPQAVLIRGIRTNSGSSSGFIAGPGKTAKYLKVDSSLYGEDVTTSSRIWIEDIGVRISSRQIIKAPRVGIDYAGSYWASKPWRFKIDIGTSIS